jgi:hypothetical protein
MIVTKIDHLDIVVITSSFNYVEKLNKQIYQEIEREGYHNLVTETKDGIQQSLTIFRGIKNLDFLKRLVSGYEYLNDTTIYLGKVMWLEKYLATEYKGTPTRIKVIADNNQQYDIPLIALEHLGIPYFSLGA